MLRHRRSQQKFRWSQDREIYDNLLKVIGFLELEVCGVDPQRRGCSSPSSITMQVLGKMLWEDAPEEINGTGLRSQLLRMLNEKIPGETVSLHAFEPIAASTKCFERELVAMGIVKIADGE